MYRRIALILFFVFLGLLFVHSLNSINQDIGRHLKSGEIIWESGSVYKTNLFSFTEPDQSFINHHWLGEVIFYLTDRAVGLEGLIILKTILLVLVVLVLFLSTRGTAGIGHFLLTAAFAAPLFLTRTDIRPEIFSYLCLSIFLFVCFRAKYVRTSDIFNQKWLYALPFVQILWTNTHIYFALGPMIMLFFLIDRYFLDRANFKKYLLTFLAVSAATLINPNFINGALAPLTILNNYGYSVLENQNIFFLKDYGLHIRDIVFFQFSLVVLIVTAIFAIKKSGIKKLSLELMLAAVFSILAFKMIRNFGLYGFAFVPIVSIFLSYPQKSVERHVVSFNHKWGYLGIIGVLVWLIFNVPNNGVYDALASNKRFGLIVPEGAAKAVEFVKENNIKGPVFNNFDVGSFLIWKLYPEQKVFVDGRPEAYSVEFFEKIYKPMQENPALWEKYSDEYGINYVFFSHTDITPWARTFLKHISKNPDWPIVYTDESVVIFQRGITR